MIGTSTNVMRQELSYVSSHGCVPTVLHRSGVVFNAGLKTIESLFKKHVYVDVSSHMKSQPFAQELHNAIVQKSAAQVWRFFEQHNLALQPKFILKKREASVSLISSEPCTAFDDSDPKIQALFPDYQEIRAVIHAWLLDYGILNDRQGMVDFLINSSLPIYVEQNIRDLPKVKDFVNNKGYIHKRPDQPGQKKYHKLAACLNDAACDMEIQFAIDRIDAIVQRSNIKPGTISPLSSPMNSPSRASPKAFQAIEHSSCIPALSSQEKGSTQTFLTDASSTVVDKVYAEIPFPDALRTSADGDPMDGWLKEASRPFFLDEIAHSIRVLETRVRNAQEPTTLLRKEIEPFFQILAKDLSLLQQVQQTMKLDEKVYSKRDELEQQLKNLWSRTFQQESTPLIQQHTSHKQQIPVSVDDGIPMVSTTPLCQPKNNVVHTNPIPSPLTVSQEARAWAELTKTSLKSFQESYGDVLQDIQNKKSLSQVLLDKALSLSQKAYICMHVLYAQPVDKFTDTIAPVFAAIPIEQRILISYFVYQKKGLPVSSSSQGKIKKFQTAIRDHVFLQKNHEGITDLIENLEISNTEKEDLKKFVLTSSDE